ncbi:ABC transporter permease [Actinokineospora sp. G85]|uniref:ABC transporter permease n=1 Tax=Actinokineospora sp. G85 TaxID=3406626 RepID=UPI003C776C47
MTDALVPAQPAAPTPARSGGGGLGRYVAAKVGAALLSLALIVVLGFLLFRALLPGDAVRTMTRGRPVSADGLAELERQYGLDLPLWRQFLRYLGNLAQGDLEQSYTFRVPVIQKIGERLGPTLLLVGVGTLIAVALGLWLGQRTAWRRDSAFDRTATGVALVLWSAPTFWVGLLLLSATSGLFPSGGITYPDTPPGFWPQALDTAHHMVLPTLTLVAVVYAQYQLVMRTSLIEEMHADHLLTARAKGLTDDRVRRHHAVPNALLPTVTLVFLHLGLVVSGAITVETVFSWPGLGLLISEALRAPDYPLLQGTFLVLAAAVVVMNLVADLLYRVLDPRVRAA